MRKPCLVHDLGTADYPSSVKLQHQAVEKRTADDTPDILFILEHPPTITLGRKADRKHLLVTEAHLADEGISLVETERGGDITYHGPGQIVAYPIFNLRDHKMDIGWYLRQLEEVGIRFLSAYGLKGYRLKGLTGVWINDMKIMAIGVAVRRWIAFHGLAMNVAPEMSHFELITPCGIVSKGVTCLQSMVRGKVALSEAKNAIADAFAEVFDLDLSWSVE